MINKRIFGTPIEGKVRTMLEQRQADPQEDEVSPTLEPEWNEELQTYVLPEVTVTGTPNKPFNISEKTAFVRMWCGVKLIEAGGLVELETVDVDGNDVLGDNANPEDDPDFSFTDYLSPSYWFDSLVSSAKNVVKTIQPSIYNLGVRVSLGMTHPGKVIVPIRENGKLIGYSIRGKREQADHVRKIYEVNNHNTPHSAYGENPINSSLQVMNTAYDEHHFSDQFPQIQKKNPFMKPPAGITQVTSETEGGLGIIKKTTVKFLVHNFYDYDNIFNKYFLKPGATIFVDFGWSDIDNLYRPEDLLNYKSGRGIQEYLYGESELGQKEGFMTKNLGNVEVLQGLVTDYNSKILKNGSVECEVTLTSANNALLSFRIDPKALRQVKEILRRGILYFGIRQLASDSKEDTEQLQSILGAVDTDSNATDAKTVDDFEQNLKLLAIKNLSGDSFPGRNSTATGIFVDNFSAENIYIAWGLFEDMIINSTFGFAPDKDALDAQEGFEVTMNSEASFIGWTKHFKERQHVLMRVPEDKPVFLYPELWGWTDVGGIGTNQSYSFQKGKYPVEAYPQKYGPPDTKRNIATLYQGESGYAHSTYDTEILQGGTITGTKDFGRIPMRELFVSVETIIKAFEESPNIKKALEEILKAINEDSDGFYDLQLSSGNTSAQLKVIDKAYTIDDQNRQQRVTENPHFTFKIMSENSQVKDYDLEFKLPEGNLGNMYAIQGMSHGNSLFSAAYDVHEAVAIAAADPDALSLIYEPDMGSLRLDQLLELHNDTEESIYHTMEDIFSEETLNVAELHKVRDMIDGDDDLTEAGVIESTGADSVRDTETSPDELVEINDKMMEARGFHVVTSFREYYKLNTTKEVISKTKPTLLPYNLSLTTPGFSAIVPGDTFKVDYLPKMYLDSTYLQTTKVIHDIGTDGWFTTLETQFRLKPGFANNIQNVDRDQIRISAKVLNKQTFEEELDAEDGWFNDTELKISDLTPYMTDATVYYKEAGRLDYVLKFKMTDKLHDALKASGGHIDHEDTNFYAGWAGNTWFNDAASACKRLDLKVYVDDSWADWVLKKMPVIGGFYESMTDFFSGEDAFEKGGAHESLNLMGDNMNSIITILRPPQTILEPGKEYFIMVKGETFGIVPGGYLGKAFVTFFNKHVGGNGGISWTNQFNSVTAKEDA